MLRGTACAKKPVEHFFPGMVRFYDLSNRSGGRGSEHLRVFKQPVNCKAVFNDRLLRIRIGLIRVGLTPCALGMPNGFLVVAVVAAAQAKQPTHAHHGAGKMRGMGQASIRRRQLGLAVSSQRVN